jgi:glycosyltransferase involved in cell wall biosynthesis
MPSGEISSNQRKGFLFLGRWIPNKGLRILIEAYHQLAPDPQTWPLNLVGDGPLRPEVEKLIMDKKIKGVILHGFVSEEERLHRTRQAKWMVTPPHTNEDLGLTPLEARSVGVPCIVSEDGGVPETGGVHALRCEPNSVESLLSCLQRSVNMKESEYERMSLLAKERLEDYVRPLDEYAEEYLKLVGKR